MWLISWLTGRVSRVLEWFGNSYSKWSLRLKNFFTWLRYYRDQAVKWGKDWGLPKIISYWQDAKNRIGQAKLSMTSWMIERADEISIFLSGKIQGTKDFLSVKISYLQNKYFRLGESILIGDTKTKTFLQRWAENFINKMLAPFTWIIGFKDFITELQDLFTEDNKIRFLTLINDLFSFLLDFATRPLKTLIGIIQPAILELISFSIAYALGTEEYELPDWPDWLTFTPGGNGGYLPPGVKQDLVSPLRKLRISGYTFNNPPGHMALDLGVLNGDPVYSMHSGTVEYINRSFVNYGYQITVGGGFWWTRYAHLQKILVSPGQHVSKGQKIGLGDDTGRSTGPHLHLEIKYKGSFVDPAKILF